MASTFTSTGSSLTATHLPAALFEAARLLDAAENSRNAANPGIAAKQNISVTVDFGTRTAAIAATIPATFGVDTAGKLSIDASDYLGAPYSTFTVGSGQVKSADVVSAFVEVAQYTAAAEKQITPIEDQPNNVQITMDAETTSITINANLPITTSAGTGGEVIIDAVDYL